MKILKKIIVSMVSFLTISLYLCNVILAQQSSIYASSDITEHFPEVHKTDEIPLSNENEKDGLEDKWPWLLGGILLIVAGIAGASSGGGGGDGDDSSPSNVTVTW